jgi:hypothetical protein
MPYPNEHACRLHPPGRYASFSRVKRRSASIDKTHDVIRGKKSDGSYEDQAYRYKIRNWTEAQAREHCNAHGGTFEAATPEANTAEVFTVSSAQDYTIREAMLDGRKQIVVPVVLMVEGVHTGVSGIPIFYSSDELAQHVESWNGAVVPVFHPFEGDRPVSANSPEVIESQVVGRLFHARFDQDASKLRAEIWFDEDKAMAIEPALLSIIRSGRQLEVSTGLFGDIEEASGTWNGEAYEAVMTNIRPDHLAVLPGGQGACSWADGCGVRANQATLEEPMTKAAAGQLPFGDPASISTNATGTLNAGIPAPVAAPIIDDLNAKPSPIAALRALKDLGFAWTINADVSHDSIRGKLQQIVNTFDSDQWINWVRTVFDAYFIYEARGHNPATGGYSYHLYKRDYSMGDAGVVTLGETVTEVIEETVYTPVPEMAANKRKEKDTMKKTKIDALIANTATRFVECDRPWLDSLSDEQIDKLTPAEVTPAAAPATNAAPVVAKTADEYVAAAPPEFKPLLVNALARENAAKKTLIDALLANTRNKFTKEQLEAMCTVELQKLADLGAVEVNFEGKGGGPAPAANTETVLEAPKTFEKK